VFHVRIRVQYSNDVNANSYFVPGNVLHLPKDLRPLVRETIASYTRSLPPLAAAAPARARASSAAPRNTGTWTNGCRAARATGAYSFAEVRQAYGLATAGRGTGGSVAILNDAEGTAPRDRADLARCFHLPAHRVRTLLTDGQAGPFPRGTFEPQEDLALARGMAPQLRSVLQVQAWGSPDAWFLGAARVLEATPRPDTFSISYGYCEQQILGKRAPRAWRAGAGLLDSMFVRLGLAGVGVFASAGDFGSTCNGLHFAGATWPASSPYVTAVGGSRLVLNKRNRRVREVVWNDLRWLPAGQGGGAGGGGFSAFYARPPFQRSLSLPGARRTVPDLSAHASLYPAWPVVIGGNWITDGGTSAASPLVASAFAVLDARQRATGRPPLGPVDGLLYWLERRGHRALFDITAGNNGYAPGIANRKARRGYDLASGVGVPMFDRVTAMLPPPGSN
jgi:kumamolisin